MNRFQSITSSLAIGTLLLIGFNFSGCTAMNTAIKKSDLEIQTKMSDTIFLEPVSPEDKVVFFDMRNTSDKDVNVVEPIKQAFRNRGYRITENPKEATYMLQGNILKVGKSDLREATDLLKSGYRSGAEGAILAGGTAAVVTKDVGTSVGAGLLGAAAGFIGDALVEDVLYVMVTDLQIRERPLEGEIVEQSQHANYKQGTVTNVNQRAYGGKINWKTYRTRIVSTANQVNLEYEEAQPALEKALAKSISGVF